MKFNKIAQLALLLIFAYAITQIIAYAKFYYKIHTAIPYVRDSYSPTPVSEGNTFTWIIHKYLPIHNAGSEWMAHSINKYLLEKGSHVNVIVNTTPVEEFERVKLIYRNDLETVEPAIRNSAVILTHHTNEHNAVRTSAIVKRPVVCVMHDEGRKMYLQEYARLAHRKNIYLIHNSNWLKKFYSIYGFKSFVLYPPVNWREYITETSREYVVLINCNENKGGGLLIDIAKKMPDVNFLGVLGAYNRQIVDNNLSNLTYVKQTSYIKEIYSQADILLMPSRDESWGRTAIEAMSSGIPVIANDAPGLLESCGEAGIYCKRHDLNSWIKTIRRLKTDAAYYKSVSERCSMRAKALDPAPQLQACSEWLATLEWEP